MLQFVIKKQGQMGAQIPNPKEFDKNMIKQGNQYGQGQRPLFNSPTDQKQKQNDKLILQQLKDYLQNQRSTSRCRKRIQLVENTIYRCQKQLLHDGHQNREAYFFQEIIKRQLINHEQRCFLCSGKYWEMQQWQIPSQQLESQLTPTFHRLKSYIGDNKQLELVIYKYIQKGDSFQKTDKIRAMQIYKKPLSQHQLTDLIFHHQFLVVQCQKSYWSFQKNTKKLIIQNSRQLSDVRDKVEGEPRLTDDGFKWFGLKDQWHPSILLESNTFVIDNIAEVRAIASRRQQIRLNYNLLEANCKKYANYIMQSSLSGQKWKEITSFFSILIFN